MNGTTTTIDRSADLRSLYASVQNRMSCRSCGLAGFDIALESK